MSWLSLLQVLLLLWVMMLLLLLRLCWPCAL
jgi:hypothetical protein